MRSLASCSTSFMAWPTWGKQATAAHTYSPSKPRLHMIHQFQDLRLQPTAPAGGQLKGSKARQPSADPCMYAQVQFCSAFAAKHFSLLNPERKPVPSVPHCLTSSLLTRLRSISNRPSRNTSSSIISTCRSQPHQVGTQSASHTVCAQQQEALNGAVTHSLKA